MKIYEIIWKEQFVEKIEVKHGIYIEEVEAVYPANRTSEKLNAGTSRVKIYSRLRSNEFRQIFDHFLCTQRK